MASSGSLINTLNITPGQSTGQTVLALPCANGSYNLTLKSYFGSYQSNLINASTSQPPANPTNLNCTNLGTNTLTLNWTPSISPSLATQNVYRNGVKTNSFGKTTITTPVTGLTPLTSYTFKVTSLNANGDESDGGTVVCQTISATPPDTDPPIGTLLINNNATYTKLNLVTLNLTTNDAVQMKFSNTATGPWSVYENYNTTKTNWDLNAAAYGGNTNQGNKTVYVKLRDSNGNETTVNISDSIIYDTVAPITTANPLGNTYGTNQTVTLSSEAGAVIKYAKRIAATTDCMAPSVIYSTYTAPIAIEDNVSEGKVCFYATDLAGNIETPIKSQTYIIDKDPPESHILSLNQYTKNKNFNLIYTTSNSTDLAYVEVYVSYNNGAYVKYTDVTHTDGHFFLSPIAFTAGSDGNYKFYSIAVDNLGNTEAVPVTLPDAQTIVDTVAPSNPSILLEAPDFTCNNSHDPKCHTDKYDVTLKFPANSDYKEIYISGDVSNDSGSTYYGNINTWIPYSTAIKIPLNTSVDSPSNSKNKTITIKVRDAAGNESSIVSTTFRLWKNAPFLNSSNLTVQNCTMLNGICYSDKLNQTLTVNVGTNEENQYYEFYLSGDVSGPNTNTWLLYKNYAGTINFQVTPGDGMKNVIFKVRSPSGLESNSVTKQIKLRQNAPSFTYQINPTVCLASSTPSVCHTYQSNLPLIITPGEDVYQIYITGNLDENHVVYGNNVNRWLSSTSNVIVPLTTGLGDRNIFMKVKDIFGHESVEILRQALVKEFINTNQEDVPVVVHPVTQGDTDNDGMPDYWEIQYGLDPNNPNDANQDKDKDGLSNLDEYLYGSNPTLSDTDKDGLTDNKELKQCPNILKPDSDNDGLLDGKEVELGTNPCNPDSDGDGILDGVEVSSGTDPLDPNNQNITDSDGDGIPDAWEIAHGLDPNNPKDAYQDADNDGLINRAEYELGTDLRSADTDKDGLKDGAEVNTYFTDPLKADTDGDGILDGKEVRDGTNPLDPKDPGNNTKNDKDGNKIDDAWENQYYQDLPHSLNWYQTHDTDKDGLTDYEEYILGTNPLLADTDKDGLTDYEEIKIFQTNPLKKDSDGDGLSDFDEVRTYKTNPNQKDTDGDKFGDGSEVELGTNPLDPLSFPGDRDGDGMPDEWEKQHGLNPDDKNDANLDPDKDGLSNRAEYKWNTDPRNSDTDGDGLSDGREVQMGTDPLNPDSKFKDENKNGIDDEWEMKYFNELRNDLGTRDYDKDGLSDKLEYDYKTDPTKQDTDGDGLTDTEEIFVYGTDPLDPMSNKKYFAITNIKDNTYLSTGDPIIKGIAPPNGIVKITFEDENQKVFATALTISDENSIFVSKLSKMKEEKESLKDLDFSLFKSPEDPEYNLKSLPDGKYILYATLYDKQGRKRSKTKPILIEIDSTLNLDSPNPQHLSDQTLTIENFFQGVEVIICDQIPEVRGTTYFGSQVVATWRSLVLTSSLIADSAVGEFSIFSPKPLEFGKHTVTLYAITPDGIRSPDLTIPFEITSESSCHSAASN